jgi:uncharacterized protein YukE
MRLTTDQLSIYLHDHLAASTFGVELARRVWRENQGTSYEEYLAGLAKEIDEDRAALQRIADELRAGRDELKTVAAWTGEKLGRLKLNGRLTGYAPLSRVLELEGLASAVQGKLGLWRSLRELSAEDSRLDRPELDALIERGERQLAALRTLHQRAAREAFRTG